MYGNLDQAEDWLREWTARASSKAEAAQRMSERVAALTATATGHDGAIKVTVGGSGVVTAMELDDRVRSLPGRELATQIMRVISAAQAGLTAGVAEVVNETVGAETETGQAVLGSFERRFPTTTEEEGQEGRRG